MIPVIIVWLAFATMTAMLAKDSVGILYTSTFMEDIVWDHTTLYVVLSFLFWPAALMVMGLFVIMAE